MNLTCPTGQVATKVNVGPCNDNDDGDDNEDDNGNDDGDDNEDDNDNDDGDDNEDDNDNDEENDGGQGPVLSPMVNMLAVSPVSPIVTKVIYWD